MDITFSATTEDTSVDVGRSNVDYLPDVLETFLNFLHGAGYTYVRHVSVTYDDGREVGTL